MNMRILPIALCLLFLFSTFAVAQDLTGKQIVEKMRDREEAKTTIMQVKMTIFDKHGDQRVRSVINRMKDYSTGGKTAVTFIKPDDVKGTKFLVVENKKGDDDQLLYMPALKKVRRISSQQKSGKFMGTDFSYADLQSHDPDKGAHEKLGEEAVDGNDCYKVRTTPNDPDDYEYSKIIYWVRKDNFIPVKGEFYDKKGELLKVLTVSGMEKDAKGHWVVKDTVMKNVQKGTSTRMEILQHKTDTDIADDYFTERFLTDETKM